MKAKQVARMCLRFHWILWRFDMVSKRIATLIYLSFFVTLVVHADFYIAINKNNNLEALAKDELKDLYLGRSRKLPNGDFVFSYDLKGDCREMFYLALLGVDIAKVDTYWSRLQFSGRVVPPKKVDQYELTRVLEKNDKAIGYFKQKPDSDELKVLMTLGADEC